MHTLTKAIKQNKSKSKLNYFLDYKQWSWVLCARISFSCWELSFLIAISMRTIWYLPFAPLQYSQHGNCLSSERAKNGRKQERKQSLNNLILEMTSQSLLSHSIYQKQIIRSSTHSMWDDIKAWLLKMEIFGSCFRSWLL